MEIEKPISLVDKAVKQIKEPGDGRQEEASWAYKEVAQVLIDEIGAEKAEDIVVEWAATRAGSVRISYVDTDPEIMEDMPHGEDEVFYEPSETLVRLALGLNERRNAAVLAEYLRLPTTPTPAYVDLATKPASGP